MPVTNAQDMAKAGSLINSDGTTVSVAADLLIADKLVHTGDTNTAIRFPAADTVTVETSGTERVRVGSSGNVGIGTTNPTNRLTVRDSTDISMDANGSGQFMVEGNGYSTAIAMNATGTFIYNNGSGRVMAFGVNEVERLRIDSSGNVGIGETSPTFTSGGGLHIKNATRAQLRLQDSTTNVFSEIGIADNTATSNFLINVDPTNIGSAGCYFAINTAGTERLRIDSSGRVGIGTSSPRGRFEASDAYLSGETGAQCIFPLRVTIGYGGGDYGSIGYNLDYRSATSNTTGVKYLTTDTISQLDFTAGGFIFRNAPTGTSGNTATLTERLRINSSGNVGIGTNNPDSKLTIQGGFSDQIILRNTATDSQDKGATYSGAHYTNAEEPVLVVGGFSTNTQNIVYVGGGWSTGNTATDIRFFTAANNTTVTGTERLRITSGGDLLVGTTSNFSADKLCLAFGASQNGIGIRDDNNTSGASFAVFRNSANGICGSITRVTTTNAVNYNTSSDYRLKTNIEPISNAVDRLKQLSAYRFNWLSEENGNKVDGFLAHEVSLVIPEAIHGEKDAVDADGKPIYQGIDQSKIVPLLTAALKEAIAKIEILEAKVSALEGA